MSLDNPYAIPSLISTVCFIALAAYVLWHNPKRTQNQVTALMFLSLIIWSFAELLERLAGPSPDVLMAQWEALGRPYPPTTLEGYDFAYFACKLIGVGVLLIPPAAVHFSLVVPRRRKVNKLALASLYGIYLVLLVVLLGTDHFVAEPEPYYAGWGSQYGDWLSLYFGFPLVCVLFTVAMMVYSFLKADSVIERNQAKFVLLGMLSSVFLVIPTAIIPSYLDWEMYPLTTVSLIILAAFMTYAMVKYKLFTIEAVTERAFGEVESRQRLEPGFSYLLVEKGTYYSYEIFRGMVSTTPGLAITTFYPQKFREEYALEKTPIIWLTDTETEEKTLEPSRLDFEISYTLTSFMKENEKTVVLIDDVKYLAMVNGFQKTLEFLKSLSDVASMSNSTIIAPITPELFDEGEYTQLEGLFDKAVTMPGRTEDKEGKGLKRGYSYIVKEARPSRTYSMVKGTKQPFLCLTKTYPEKVRKLHGLEGGSFYWLTSGGGEERNLDPSRLQFEVTHTVIEYIKANRGGLVIIDGADQLIAATGFDQLADFFKVVVDLASVNNVTVLVPVPPKGLEPVQMAILEKRFDFVIEGEEP